MDENRVPNESADAKEKLDKISLQMEDLKAVFGDRFKVAYLKASIIPGASTSLMIPANEPCPTQPHNHDKLALDQRFQKYIVIEL
jgi:hypothetical protein